MKAWTRLAAATLALAGVAVLTWAAVTVLWKEPLTLYRAERAQAKLEQQLDLYRVVRPVSASVRPEFRPSARFTVNEGHAAGRIRIPSLDVDAVFVEGTDEEELKKGPGHYPITHWPGQGKVIAIAGHRTTYGAWFRHMDELDSGDPIVLTMPYGRYVFHVTKTEIVDDADWSILRGKGEFLVLSACHPLYSAAQRLVVTARAA
jgi:sortase A